VGGGRYKPTGAPAFNPRLVAFYGHSMSLYCASLSHGNLVILIPRPVSLITINRTEMSI
jgi:hypothetical protein